MADLTHDDMANLEKWGVALYEARLAQLGPHVSDADEGRFARLWASCALGEAMCVLEIQFGQKMAGELIQRMVDSRERYTGPRTKRMRN